MLFKLQFRFVKFTNVSWHLLAFVVVVVVAAAAAAAAATAVAAAAAGTTIYHVPSPKNDARFGDCQTSDT